MAKIRILHVFGALNSGGAESRTMDIYREIDRNIVQFDFLVHTHEKGFFDDEIRALGGNIYRVPRFNLKNLTSYIRGVDDFFRDHKEYRIIHGHILSTAFIYFKIAKKYNIPVRIAHSRSGTRAQLNIVNIIKELTEKLSKLYVTDMLAVSKIAGYSAFGKRDVDSGKVAIMPNAIKADKYTFNKNLRQDTRKELNIENSFVVGHIGRFSPQKNHEFIIDIFNEIKKKNEHSKLILVGEGPLRSSVKSKVLKLGLEKDVLFLGVRSDVPNLLNAMDTLLFPSTHEGLPGVVLEAQASGLPCIISDKITSEVRITDLVEYLSLDKSAGYWADVVLDYSSKIIRKNTYDKIVEAGYDTKAVAKWYESYYSNSIDSSK
ncbi:MAG: glycosyltransferase family 1 protein [Epulopiscium sp.]|nr:glycosyltransferase family 1 protein [Candidatus Epulonipiscium sp.]